MTRHHSASHRGRDTLGIFLRRWHRRLGLATAVFVFWLAASGMLLNHTSELKLGQRPLHAAWLLSWYGLANDDTRGFRVGQHWLASAGDTAVLDGKAVPALRDAAMGLVATPNFLAAASATEIVLLTPGGELVEHLDAAALPGIPLTRIGTSGELVIVETGGRLFASADGGQWQPYTASAAWSSASELPPEVQNQLRQSGPGVSAERLLEDLHSGRFFGPVGVYLVDLVALVFGVLAVTGFWLWARRPARPRG